MQGKDDSNKRIAELQKDEAQCYAKNMDWTAKNQDRDRKD